MAGKDMIAMSQEDLKRLAVMHKVIDKRVTQVEAAGILDLCDRQIRRIAARIVQEGDKGVVHRSRGQPSHNAINPKIKKRVIDLCKDVYEGFGPTLASEKLFERDRIPVSRETLRQWLKEEQLPYRDRKKRPYRHWRERKECYGQMIQMDGSEHDWFEGPSGSKRDVFKIQFRYVPKFEFSPVPTVSGGKGPDKGKVGEADGAALILRDISICRRAGGDKSNYNFFV